MLTGHYPTETGVLDNRQWWGREHPDWKTLPRWFREHGFATLREGKIFHEGIDDPDAWVVGGQARRYPDDSNEGIDVVPQGNTTRQERPSPAVQYTVLEGNGESYQDYQHASKAIELLGKYGHGDQPFFFALGFTNPHSPPRAPKKFYDMYDLDKIPLPEDFAHRPTVPPGFPELSVVPVNTDLFVGRDASEKEAREVKRAYWASVSFMDEQVGRVLKALDDLKLRDNTIVVFWGDHGYHLGEKGRWSKAYSLFDVAVRSPLLISVPGNPSNGTTCDRNVETLNFYKTFCDFAGIPAPPGVEGVSMAPLVRTPTMTWNRPVYSVVIYRNNLGRSVRTDQWRYSQWVEGEKGEVLFDEQKDPHELKNLAADPQYAKPLAEMRALMKDLPGRTR
jgi:arylsulfatase A-like enzyme